MEAPFDVGEQGHLRRVALVDSACSFHHRLATSGSLKFAQFA